MTDYPPEVADLLARGAEVTWCPLVADGAVVGGVVLAVAWPLRWDSPWFRTPATGRDALHAPDAPCVPRRRDATQGMLPRPGPACLPACPQAP